MSLLTGLLYAKPNVGYGDLATIMEKENQHLEMSEDSRQRSYKKNILLNQI